LFFNEEPKDIKKLVVSLDEACVRNENGVFKADVCAKIISLDEKQLEEAD